MEKLNDAAQRFQARLTDEELPAVARDLGVSARALRELGCGLATAAEMRALAVGFAKGPVPSVAVSFPERDEHGAIIGICFRATDGRKGTPTGSKRGLVFSTRPDEPDPVVLAEGPSDTAAGTTLFLTTIGRPSNTGGAELIAGIAGLGTRDVLVLADSDAPGIDGAKKVAQELANRWKRPVPWTSLPSEHKDLREYVRSLALDCDDDERCAAAGERLIAGLRARAQLVKPQAEALGLTKCIADIETRPLKWLLHPCIPLGKLAILAGHPGLGKSLVSVDMAARLSRGRGLNDERAPDGPVDVLLLSAEDDPGDTIRPRLEAAGADLNRVHVSRCLDLSELARMLDERPAVRLVVVDPMSAYTGHVQTHNDAQVRTLLAAFFDLASERGITILFVAHLRKSEEGDAIMRPGGSVAFVAAARIAWIVLKDPDDEQRRYVLPLKNNLGADALGFAYRIEADGPEAPPRVAWETERVTETADEILARSRRDGGAGRGEALDEASEFLREQLRAGPRAAADMVEGAKARGIAEASLKRARKKVGVLARKLGMDGGWEWSLPPEDGEPKREGDQVPPVEGSEPLRQDASSGQDEAAPENVTNGIDEMSTRAEDGEHGEAEGFE